MKPDLVRTILLGECSTFNGNGFDTDIDLYVSLTEDKKYKQAASLYEKHLIPRYPDEYCRVRIIRYYRKKDSRFSGIYAGAVKEIFERIVSSVKKLILHVSSVFEGNISNPYELLKKIELALRVIPQGRDEAVRFIEKMETYSILLDYKTEEFSNAADILKRYFDNTLFVKIEVKKEKKGSSKKESYAEAYAREEAEKRKKVTIDLESIEFSDDELKMICIDDRIKIRSYQVLAYCRLYWRLIFNQDFEKKIFLYSRKYSTIHYKIFQIIKNCRVKRIGDDVILLEIYSLLSSGYQYSLREDALMQAAWRRIKPYDSSAGRQSDGQEKQNTIKEDFPVKTEKKKEKAAEKKSSSAGHLRLVERKAYSRSGRLDAVILSLGDRLEKMCLGDDFNAHDEFANLLPKYIERYLVRHRKKESVKDPYVLKGALYIISTFITDNYNSASASSVWKESVSRTEVTNMGFIVPEIDTIIALCLEEVRMRRAVA